MPDDAILMSMTDVDGLIVFANQAFSRISGYTPEEMLGQSHNLVRHPDMPPEVFADMWDTLNAGRPWSGLIKNRCSNGDHYWGRANATPIHSNGETLGFVSVRTRPQPGEVEEATQLYQAIREGRARHIGFDNGVVVRIGWTRWFSVFQRLSVRARIRLAGAVTTGAAAFLLFPAFVGAGGSPQAAVGALLAIATTAAAASLILERRIAEPLDKLLEQAQAIASGEPGIALNLERTDEIGMLKRAINQAGLNLRALHGNVAAFHMLQSETPSAVAPVSTTFTHIARAIDRMEHQLDLDILTGTCNRNVLERKFHAAIQQIQAAATDDRQITHALLFIDLDNFKAINDVHGHDIGDQVLVTVARRLMEAVRVTDVVARYGGDEFCALLHDIGGAIHVEAISEKIRAAVGECVETACGPIYTDVSIGYSIFHAEDNDIQAVIRSADQHMLEIKARRKSGRVVPTGISVEQELYGRSASALKELQHVLQICLPAIVEQFQEYLLTIPGADTLIRTLSDEELLHLKERHTRNLLALASPALTAEAHRESAIRAGHAHAIIGLPRESLLYGHDWLHTSIRSHVNTATHGEALSLMVRRLIRDMVWQIEAFQEVQFELQALLRAINQVAQKANSYTDLVTRVAEVLGAHDEITACAFYRPDMAGQFRYDALCGTEEGLNYVREAEMSLEGTAGQPPGRGATSRAWREGEIRHHVNFSTDPAVEPWRELARKHGIRSSMSIPLCHPGQLPVVVLSLYSAWPGGYSSDDHRAFAAQLQLILATAIGRIERQSSVSSVPCRTRGHFADLLRSNALDMHYQPILDLHTGAIVKVEALARLRDGDRVLTPGEFFPGLTQEDFHELYVRGIEQSLSWRSHWLAEGHDIAIALNLPAGALGDPRYYEATQRALQQHDCPPDRLTLEILETDEVPSGIDIPVALDRLKTLGVRLAEDDLGSGYSSLSRLDALPFDIVKIDRGIVAPRDRNPMNVLRFIYQLTRLGHSLGKAVVAEGVENEELLEAIRILGVDGVQGYVISRPMSAQHMTQWLRNNSEVDLVAAALKEKQSGTLPELAKLLIWEEWFHLLQSDMLHPSEIPDASTGTMSNAISSPDVKAAIDLRERLVQAAVSHGMSSVEYREAREQLVMALTTVA